MKLIHISVGGPERIIIDAKGKEWVFEDHPQCGPIVLNKRGDPQSNQPGARSPFWKAWGHWHDQGEKIEGAARCVWVEPPPPPPLVHLGGRNYAVAGSDACDQVRQEAEAPS